MSDEERYPGLGEAQEVKGYWCDCGHLQGVHEKGTGPCAAIVGTARARWGSTVVVCDCEEFVPVEATTWQKVGIVFSLALFVVILTVAALGLGVGR